MTNLTQFGVGDLEKSWCYLVVFLITNYNSIDPHYAKLATTDGAAGSIIQCLLSARSGRWNMQARWTGWW